MPFVQPPRSFSIGPWLVDTIANEARRDEEIVRLEPKATAVLVHLAGRPGEVVTREELLKVVWHGVVVTDASLTRCISQLRQALDDDPRSPRFIETIPRVGYRLLVSPEAVHQSGTRLQENLKGIPTCGPHIGYLRRIIAGVITLVVIAIVTLWLIGLPLPVRNLDPVIVEYSVDVEGTITDPVVRYTGDDGKLYTVDAVSFPYVRSVQVEQQNVGDYEIRLIGMTEDADVYLSATARRGRKVLSESQSTATLEKGAFRDFDVYTFVTLDR